MRNSWAAIRDEGHADGDGDGDGDDDGVGDGWSEGAAGWLNSST